MSSSRARVLLLGMGVTAESAFAALVERFDVCAVVCSAPPGDVLAQRAAALGVPMCTDTSLTSVARCIEQHQPDGVVVSSYDRVLPANLLAGRPFVNVHYAPLPRYRGRATVNWALINGETSWAITVHVMTPALDDGGILVQQSVPITDTDTVSDVYARLNDVQQRVLAEAVSRCLAGDPGRRQAGEATYACTRVPADGEIDWTRPTAQIGRLVRALAPPYPGAYTYRGRRRLWVTAGHPLERPPVFEGRIPGRVVQVSRTEGWVDVLTGDGVFRLEALQADGEDAVPAYDHVRSVRETLGLQLRDLAAYVAELEAELRGLRGQLTREGRAS